MVFLVGHTVINRPALAGQNLNIVIGCFRAAPRYRAIERGAATRHGIDVDLIRGSALGCSPCAAAVDRRPLVTDVCAIFGFDGRVFCALPASGAMRVLLFSAGQTTAKTIAPPIMGMLFLAAGIDGIVQIEGNGIFIARKVRIDDRGTVACNGHTGKLRLGLFAVISDRLPELTVRYPARTGLPGEVNGSACCGVDGFRGVVGVSISPVAIRVGILDPVVQRIGSSVFRPFGIESDALALVYAEGIFLRQRLIRIPAGEGIAGLRRGGGLHGCILGAVELGLDIGAAVGDIRHPEALGDPGIELHARVLNGIGGHRFAGMILIQIPAEEALVRAAGALHIGGGNDGLGRALLRFQNARVVAGAAHEEHIVNPFILRGDGEGLLFLHGDGRAEGDGRNPADELVAFYLRDGGLQQAFVVLDNLSAKLRVVHAHKGVCMNRGFRMDDGSGAHASS